MLEPIPVKFNFKSSTSFSAEKTPKSTLAIIAACSRLKDGDLIDLLELSNVVGKSKETVSCASTHPAVNPNKHQIGSKCWYGNKATIAELKKEHP